jgi:RNA polymerase sigma factor (sigma-70 family)
MTPTDHEDAPVTPELLGQLLDRHAAALELFARQWTAAADDCVQEAMIELAAQATLPDDPVAWLYRVVRNRALNAARAEGRRRQREAVRADRQASWFDDDVATELDGREAAEALAHLADEQRQAIVARIWGGLTFEQMASVLGTSRSSAQRCYAAGLAALRERLDQSCTTKNNSQTT